MIPSDLYDRYTAALTENDRQAHEALSKVLSHLDPTDVDGVRDALLRAYPALVKTYGTRAAQVAVEFYAGVREAQGVASAFAASLPAESEIYDEPECIADVRREVGGLYSGKSTFDGFASTMQGLATKRTMGMANETVKALAAADPAHPKVALVAHPGACGWCIMLSSRGFTNTEENMSHMRHDKCKCATVADFDTDNPALEGYDPEAMYQLYSESCTDGDMREWREEWDAMSADERAKYVRRTRDRTGMVKEHPGDWSTFVRNRTVQNMNKFMRDPEFTGGHEELAAWLPKQREAMGVDLRIRELASYSDKQFGRKMGEHARDFGFEPSSLKDGSVRDELRQQLDGIIRERAEELETPWRGQDGICTAYVKDGKVVILNDAGDFVTAFKEVEGGSPTLNKARNAIPDSRG